MRISEQKPEVRSLQAVPEGSSSYRVMFALPGEIHLTE